MLVFKQDNIHLGMVKYNTSSQMVIEVTNNSKTPITPFAPTGSCSCTTGYFTPSTIPANSTGKLTVNFNAGKTGLGEQAKSLTITYKLGQTTHTKVIQVKANVVNTK